MTGDVVWRVAGRGVGWGENPPLSWYEPGKAWLVVDEAGNPVDVLFLCPCGADRPYPGRCDVRPGSGRHSLEAADPLHLEPSVWPAYPCGDATERCHYWIRGGAVEWHTRPHAETATDAP